MIRNLWHRLMVWLGLEAPTADETINIFAKQEQEKESKVQKLNNALNKTRNGTSMVIKRGGLSAEQNPSMCVPPSLRGKLQKRNKVRVKDNSSTGYSYKTEDELDVNDIIIGYMIFDSLTGNYNETTTSPTPALEFNGFGGGGDFDGGGAGGSWDNDSGTVGETSTYSDEIYS